MPLELAGPDHWNDYVSGPEIATYPTSNMTVSEGTIKRTLERSKTRCAVRHQAARRGFTSHPFSGLLFLPHTLRNLSHWFGRHIGAMLLFWCVRSQTLTFKEEIGLSANASTDTCTCIYSTCPWYCHKVLLCATSCYDLWYQNKWATGGDGRARHCQRFSEQHHKLTEMLSQTHTCSFFGSLSLINQSVISKNKLRFDFQWRLCTVHNRTARTLLNTDFWPLEVS